MGERTAPPKNMLKTDAPKAPTNLGELLDGNGLFWDVVVGKIDSFSCFGRFLPIFSHFAFLVHFDFAL